MRVLSFVIIAVLFTLVSCGEEKSVEEAIQFPRIKIENQSVLESVGSVNVEVFLTWAYDQDVSVDYEVIAIENGVAVIGEDVTYSKGTVTIPAGATSETIAISIVDDAANEQDERFAIQLSNPLYGELLTAQAEITIVNDDTDFVIDDTGYTSPDVYQGYEKFWETQFEGEQLDDDIWTREVGGGGWGNNELQHYTDREANAFQTDGYLVIEAKKESFGERDYTSARLISQDKFEFRYGRVDIRAKLPKGQGIWPALWMLGANFQEVGWPKCGEIDIMELIGSSPKVVHGTAHFFGASNSNENRGTSTFISEGDFSDEFHVFSIVWRKDYIEWRLDGKKFFTLEPADLDGGEWSFNREFFLLMNIAVGGNWPGSPDDTTVFPQRMIVDYIKIFKLI